jgi:hypothetical protein
MRRALALIAAVVLVASFAGSAAASAAVPKGSSFVGNFAMSDMSDASGTAVGWANVEIRAATQQTLVPGHYDFRGAKGYSIREGHAVLGLTEFWYDSGHGADSNVAYTEGVECLYTDLGVKDCHAFTAMFVDVLDPAATDWVEFQRQDPNDPSQDPNKPETWTKSQFFVGKGSFVLHCVASSCPTGVL